MSSEKQDQTGEQRSQQPGIVENLDRVWEEIKQISRQVERETRRSGRVARLKLDIRKLRKEIFEVRARLGEAVHKAHRAGGGGQRLDEIEGYAARVAALDRLHADVEDLEAEIERLRGRPPDEQESGDPDPGTDLSGAAASA